MLLSGIELALPTDQPLPARLTLTLHNSAANTTAQLAPAGTCTHTRERPTFPAPPGAFPPP